MAEAQIHRRVGCIGLLTARNQVAFLLMFLVSGEAFSSDAPYLVHASAYDEWLIESNHFCREEPINLRVDVRNIGDNALQLSVCTGGEGRGRMRVFDSDQQLVWGSIEENDGETDESEPDGELGPIYIGGTGLLCRDRALDSDLTAFWVGSWNQKTLDGDFVEAGLYSIEVDYLWRNDEQVLIPMSANALTIRIEDCL